MDILSSHSLEQRDALAKEYKMHHRKVSIGLWIVGVEREALAKEYKNKMHHRKVSIGLWMVVVQREALAKEYKMHHRKVSIYLWVVVQRELRSRSIRCTTGRSVLIYGWWWCRGQDRTELKSVKMNCSFRRHTMRKLKIITV